MKDNFPKSLEVILKNEGAYVNDPHDPGGETNMGISKKSFPDIDIKNLTKELASAIYKKYYWDKVQGDYLPSGIDLVLFDGAVLFGPKQSTLWLQRAIGVTADGVLGPKTIMALKGADTSLVADKVLDQRLALLKTLPTWPRYGKGWTNRVDRLRELIHSKDKKW